jgi:hypothetical protein
MIDCMKGSVRTPKISITTLKNVTTARACLCGATANISRRSGGNACEFGGVSGSA